MTHFLQHPVTVAPAAWHLAAGHQADPPVLNHQRVLQPAHTRQHQGEMNVIWKKILCTLQCEACYNLP